MSIHTAATPTWTPFPLAHGRLADLRTDPFPSTFSAWSHDLLPLEPGATHFGFVFEGAAMLEAASGTFTLCPGMYFSVVGPASIGGASRGVVMSRWGARGFFQIGGPIEAAGRLRYIDGCTDSLLIPPVRRGDACLNLLHIPAGTAQSQHLHPSLRLGLIVRGHGFCHTPEARWPLEPGLPFAIRAGGLHSFHTGDEALTVIAWHPDSDVGPTDEDHPMLNRTWLRGEGGEGRD